MKKILLSFAIAAITAGGAVAQQQPKKIPVETVAHLANKCDSFAITPP